MPEVTVCFWVIKVLCTTVCGTAAGLLNEQAGPGLTGVPLLMSAVVARSSAATTTARAAAPGTGAAYSRTVSGPCTVARPRRPRAARASDRKSVV